MEKKTNMPEFEAPKVEYVPVEPVHTAKSTNPGKGHDTTGTGNSSTGQHQGNGDDGMNGNGNNGNNNGNNGNHNGNNKH